MPFPATAAVTLPEDFAVVHHVFTSIASEPWFTSCQERREQLALSSSTLSGKVAGIPTVYKSAASWRQYRDLATAGCGGLTCGRATRPRPERCLKPTHVACRPVH